MCILSANYPNDYKANDFCRFHVKANGYLKVMSWDVESDDWMKVCSPVGIFGTECKTSTSSEIARNILYSSDGGPDAVRIWSTPSTKMDQILFQSRCGTPVGCSQGKGFKICWVSYIPRCPVTDGSTIYDGADGYCTCGTIACTESKGLFCTASGNYDSDARCSPLKSCRSVDGVGGVVL